MVEFLGVASAQLHAQKNKEHFDCLAAGLSPQSLAVRARQNIAIKFFITLLAFRFHLGLRLCFLRLV
jgi:hypothetical protein